MDLAVLVAECGADPILSSASPGEAIQLALRLRAVCAGLRALLGERELRMACLRCGALEWPLGGSSWLHAAAHQLAEGRKRPTVDDDEVATLASVAVSASSSAASVDWTRRLGERSHIMRRHGVAAPLSSMAWPVLLEGAANAVLRGDGERLCWSLLALLRGDGKPAGGTWHVNAWDAGRDVRMSLLSFLRYTHARPDGRSAAPEGRARDSRVPQPAARRPAGGAPTPTPPVDALYLFDNELPAALRSTLRTPPLFGLDLLAVAATIEEEEGGGGTRGGDNGGDNGGVERGEEEEGEEEEESPISERFWLLVGGADSGTRWHFDPHGVSAWSACFEGRKLWLFWPPEPGFKGWGAGWATMPEKRPPYSAPPALALDLGAAAWVQRVLLPRLAEHGEAAGSRTSSGLGPLRWAVQRAGDLVFVPAGWWHCVLNFEATVSVQGQMILGAEGALRSAEICEPYAPRFAAQLRRLARQLGQCMYRLAAYELVVNFFGFYF